MDLLKKIQKKKTPEDSLSEDWINLFLERLSSVEMIKDLKEIENFHQLKFKIKDSSVPEAHRFFFITLDKDLFQEGGDEEEDFVFREIFLWNALNFGMAQKPGIGYISLFKTPMIQTILREKFYKRFVLELAKWFRIESEKENSAFIRQAPMIASFISEFGKKSSSLEDDVHFSKEERYLALADLGIDFDEINFFVKKTRIIRSRMILMTILRSLRKNPPKMYPLFWIKDRRILRFLSYLKKADLHFEDLGKGVAREIVRSYFNPKGNFFSIAAWSKEKE